VAFIKISGRYLEMGDEYEKKFEDARSLAFTDPKRALELYLKAYAERPAGYVLPAFHGTRLLCLGRGFEDAGNYPDALRCYEMSVEILKYHRLNALAGDSRESVIRLSVHLYRIPNPDAAGI